MHAATFVLGMRDDGVARAVARALAIDLADGPDGVRATCVAQGSAVHATVAADEAAGLRAAVTTILRLADAAQRSADLARPLV